MKIVYLHGLNSSSRSFSYVHSLLEEHDAIKIDYNSHCSLQESLSSISKQLPKTEFAIVGHSLGGVLAAIIAGANVDRVTHLVAISAPFAGSKAASTLKWIPGHPKILHDLTPNAKPIKEIAGLKLTTPTMSIISTSGHLFTSPEPNDSVVAISSQKALPFGKKVEVKANHFEVLMHEKTVKTLSSFLFDKS